MKNKAEDLYFWVALTTAPNVGAKRFLTLLDRFGTPERVLSASLSELSKTEDVGRITAGSIKNKTNWKEAEKQVGLFEKSGCAWVSIQDSDYPERLKQIADPPPFLFVRGSLDAPEAVSVAIVGSRTATDYGKTITQRLSSDLASKGISIVSGLAAGIDSYAHQAALDCGGRTVAVLGHGLDIIYPKENKKLASQIEQSGALVTEFLFGTQPEANNFPKRNRIISGTSWGVIVVEAPAKSGALLTAECALEQNREVFAVPGNLGKKTSEGANNLIRQGAKLVTCAEDVLAELNLIATKPAYKSAQPVPELASEEASIYQILSEEPIHIDKLAQGTNLSVPQTLSSLLNLELKGLVRQLSGKLFVRA